MKVTIVTPSDHEASAMREAIADAMARHLLDRKSFDLGSAFIELAAAGFPQQGIRELADIAVAKALALMPRH